LIKSRALVAVGVVLFSAVAVAVAVAALPYPHASLISTVAAAGAAALSVRAARRGQNRRARWSWYAYGLGCAVAAAWGVLWWHWQAAGGQPPAAAIAVARGLMLASTAVALWLTSRVPGVRARIRMALDGGIAASGVFVAGWAAVFAPAWVAPGADQTLMTVRLACCVADLVLLTVYAVVVTTEFPVGRRRPALLIMTGLLGLATVDFLAAYVLTPGGQGPAQTWAPMVRLFAFLAFAAAALAYSGTSERRPARVASRSVLYLPYVGLVPAVGAVSLELLAGRSVPVPALVAGGVLVLALLVRQFLMLGENRTLLERVAVRERDLEHQTLHDALTGLGNRTLLARRLAEADRDPAAPPLTLLYLDLDDFKDVNDSLGHCAGDELLVDVGQRLRAAVRVGDTVARLGGDEFAVLLTGATDEARTVAQRVLDLLSLPFVVAGRRVVLGASIGLADVRLDPAAAADRDVLRDADLAMYAAKRAGKNTIEVYHPDLHQSSTQEQELRAALLAALDAGALALAYQPVFRANSGEIVGFEALVRWTHPEWGLIPPDRLIGVAERANLMSRVTGVVIEQACADLRRWSDEGGTHLTMAVNITAAELGDPDLPGRLAAALRRHGLTGDRLVIEVTETALMGDVDIAIQAAQRIRELGARMAIDDFGTGYSSLARLGMFPVEALKIDKLFVRGVLEPRGRQMIEALVALATSCDMVTVAEGVETPGQAAALRELGCTLLQGYLLGRPMPADQASALLRSPTAGQFAPGVTVAMR
jgi:diguanylate cyclase (GGDEF)-like protein